MARRLLEHDILTKPLCSTEISLFYRQVEVSVNTRSLLLRVQELIVTDFKGATVEELHIYIHKVLQAQFILKIHFQDFGDTVCVRYQICYCRNSCISSFLSPCYQAIALFEFLSKLSSLFLSSLNSETMTQYRRWQSCCLVGMSLREKTMVQ